MYLMDMISWCVCLGVLETRDLNTWGNLSESRATTTTRDRGVVLSFHGREQSICQSLTIFQACRLHPSFHRALSRSSGAEELTVEMLFLILAPLGAARHRRGGRRGATGLGLISHLPLNDFSPEK